MPKKKWKRKGWWVWGVGVLALLSIPVVVIANWEAVWTNFNPAPVNSGKGNLKGVPISAIDLSKGAYHIEGLILSDGSEMDVVGEISYIQGNLIELEQSFGGFPTIYVVDRVILLKEAPGK